MPTNVSLSSQNMSLGKEDGEIGHPPGEQTKQGRIENAVNSLESATARLEFLADEMRDPELKNTVGGKEAVQARPHLSRFLSDLPEDIENITSRIADATGRIRDACF